MYETFETPRYLRGQIEISYVPYTAEWQVSRKSMVRYNDVAAFTTYGTDRASAYDKDLTVGGLYSSYTKIFCGEIGEADEPFVFLLTQEGWVEYIDVLSCLSCGYFCGGPLLGVADAKSLVHSSADGLPDIWAITEKGEKLGLWDIVSCQRYTIPASLQNSGWWNDEIGGSLTVSEGNGDNFNYPPAPRGADAISPFSEMGYAAANTRKYTDMFRAGEIDPSVPGQAICLEAYKESEMFYLSLINRLDQK